MARNLLYLDILIPGVVAVWLWTKYSRRRRNSQGLLYPPGPKGLPLIGNVLDMPTSFEWLTAAEWKKTYGNIVFVENSGKPIVFLGSYEGAVELMEKRSSIYSSRPHSIMMCELEGWDWLTSNMPYGDRWRRHRSYLRQHLEPAAVANYVDLQTHETHKLLGNLLRTPEDFLQHIRDSIGATIMMMAYGHEAEPENDPYITLAEKGAYALGVSAAPGAFLVEIIPWLRYVPAWIPGAGFQTVAKEAYALSQDMRYKPYYETKAKVLEGTARASMTSSLIEANMDEAGNIRDEETIANTAGMAYVGGADTAVSTIMTFVLAMVLNPDVQRRAQEELDRVVGRDRLPNIEDKESLPYVNALCNECLRWQPVAPLGAPRQLTEDDVYNGYFLPKGAMIIANAWLFLHDPEEYPDPDAFKPERFLVDQAKCAEGGNENVKVPRDPSKVAFGFGCRMCPGRHMAMNTIFLTVSSVLSAFDIQKAIGKDGRPITPTGAYVSSLISHPEPFECLITPRSERSKVLVSQTLD